MWTVVVFGIPSNRTGGDSRCSGSGLRARAAPTMPVRFLFGAVLAATALAGCGGSSSETPPPLQPDPRGFHYGPASAVAVDADDAGVLPSSRVSAEHETETTPAHPTWGTGLPKH